MANDPRPVIPVRNGIWGRIAGRTRSLFQDGLRGLGSPLKAKFYEDLEELLVAGDVGVALAGRLAEAVRLDKPRSLEEAQASLETAVVAKMSPASRQLKLEANPTCILFYGINGAGKTTTMGKLAYWFKRGGWRPLIVAADTYRAAGIEQAVAWAERAGVEFLAGAPGADPGAVVFDGLAMAASRGHNVVLVDTAGRLQTQHNLLQELGKVGRVAGRALEGAPHESLLVLDAALGQSSLSQARGFHQAIAVSGLVLAKMEGTAKGGAVVAIESELGVPVKMMGVGEGIEDLATFEPALYARSLFGTA